MWFPTAPQGIPGWPPLSWAWCFCWRCTSQFDLLPWLDIPRALPLTTAIALAVFVTLLLKHPRRMELWPAVLPMVVVDHVRPQPAVQDGPERSSLPLWFLSGDAGDPRAGHLPSLLDSAGTETTMGCGVVFRTLALVVLVAASMYYLNRSQKIYRLKDFAVGKGGDTIFTYGPKAHISGLVTSLALEWIEEKTSRQSHFCWATRRDHAQLSFPTNDNVALPQFHDG